MAEANTCPGYIHSPQKGEALSRPVSCPPAYRCNDRGIHLGAAQPGVSAQQNAQVTDRLRGWHEADAGEVINARKASSRTEQEALGLAHIEARVGRRAEDLHTLRESNVDIRDGPDMEGCIIGVLVADRCRGP